MEIALACCRFAHFLGAMMAFGGAFFALAFAPRALRAELSAPLRRLTVLACALGLLSAVAWTLLEAAAMGGEWRDALDLGTISAVLFDTAFGEVWRARLIVGVALLIALVRGRPDRWALATALGAAWLASLGLVGHAAMQSGDMGLLHRANHALHLLATGAWIGALLPFLMSLAAFARADLREAAAAAMTRFSAAGHFNVILVLGTGALNVGLTTHAPPWPPTSPYRVLLDTKLLIVITMICIALFNRYAILPRLQPGAATLKLLRAMAIVELALGAGVVALVSYFGLLDPA